MTPSVANRSRQPSGLLVTLCLLVLSISGSLAAAQGILVPGGGAIHRAMGGVSTAAPVDAIGAVYWNPAAPSRLGPNEVGISGELIYPTIDLTSSLPGGPEGRTRSDNGLGMISDVGLVYHVSDRATASLGLLTTAGGGVNFPGDPSNPVLAPIGPNGQFVLGPEHSSITVVQLMPALSMQVADNIWVGVGPTISAAVVSFTPALFGGANDANGDGLSTLPDGSGTRPFWGGGFRVGAVCHLTHNLDFGFAYTSPTWFETWKFNAKDEVGAPQTLTLDAELPATYSWGLAYTGLERWLLATDLRYLDYEDANLFGSNIVDKGLNWSSVFAAAFGARFQWTNRIALLGGYVYNDNPVPTVGTLFNIQAPALMQHALSVGASADLTDSIIVSLAYVHAFRNTVSGAPLEAIGAGLTLGAEADSVVVGLNIRFGGKGACASGRQRPCRFAATARGCEGMPGGDTSVSCECPGGACSCPPGSCACPSHAPKVAPDAAPTVSIVQPPDEPNSTAILEDTADAVSTPVAAPSDARASLPAYQADELIESPPAKELPAPELPTPARSTFGGLELMPVEVINE